MNVDALLDSLPSASRSDAFGTLTVDVDAGDWLAAAEAVRDRLGCTYFDFLSAVDEVDGIRLVAHVASPSPFGHLVLRTLLPPTKPVVLSWASVYSGAAWHERETAEMFGVAFCAPSGEQLPLEHLLLTSESPAHPLRKEFLLQSRLDRPWPGAKEPGENDADVARPSRRRLRPPGVPEEGR